MLQPIQQMRFFQCTGRGDADTFTGRQPSDNPLQVLCQGNVAAPACWLMLSSLMMNVYHRRGHMSATVSPISGELVKFMGEIYVDDTELLTFLLDIYEIKAVLKQAQINLDKWARLLIVTGGFLNPNKCYWYLISYICREGIWEYDWNASSGKLSIPLPDGSREEIIQLPVSELKFILGVWPSPDGSDAKHLQEIVVGKTRTWMNRLRNANLPTYLVWKAYRFQLGPAIWYGISTLANRSKDIENIQHSLEFKMIPCLGVNWHVKTEWQRIKQEFGGIRQFNLSIEQFIGWIKMVLQHYGTGSTISKKIRASLEAAQLEIGICGNPLEECFNTLGVLAMETWITAVWEPSSHYHFKLFLNYPVQHDWHHGTWEAIHKCVLTDIIFDNDWYK